MGDEEPNERTTLQSVLFFTALTMIMIAGTAPVGLTLKLALVGLFSILTAYFGYNYYTNEELSSWMGETYEFVKMIFPVFSLQF